jgi:uncharacterized ion transporter superfamily protein YfcC
MKIFLLIFFVITLIIYGIMYVIDFIKEIKADDFNYKKQKALHIVKNKEKYTKIQIQKAQQYLDVDAIATNFNRDLKQ